MPFSESFAELVKENMSDIEDVSFKKMFGGMGIFHDRRMFALISGSDLYFRIGEGNRSMLQKMGAEQFKPFADKPMRMPYYMVPPEIMESREEFLEWTKNTIVGSK